MLALRHHLDNAVDRSAPRNDRATRSRKSNPARVGVEALEARRTCSAGAHPLAVSMLHHHAEIRPLSTESNHAGATPAFHVQAAKKKQASFTLAQEEKLLPGKWVAVADVSSTYGIQGAFTAVEVVFTGPKGTKSFSAISALSVPGYFGRAYYQFGDSGTYQFLKKNLVRMTILQASPTEYLGNPILVMSGQFLGVQFTDKNHFVDQGVTYTREALNQSIFNQ
jgi:hypothetical protein